MLCKLWNSIAYSDSFRSKGLKKEDISFLLSKDNKRQFLNATKTQLHEYSSIYVEFYSSRKGFYIRC